MGKNNLIFSLMLFASMLQHVKDGRSLYAVSQWARPPQILPIVQELLM